MIGLSITFTGLDEALAEIDQRFALMRTNVERTLDQFGKTAADTMVATHTFQNRTFRLEGSIGFAVDRFTGHQASVSVYALAPYASEVEFGHPGARPYPFFWPVFYDWEPVLQEWLVNAVEFAVYDGRAYP